MDGNECRQRWRHRLGIFGPNNIGRAVRLAHSRTHRRDRRQMCVRADSTSQYKYKFTRLCHTKNTISRWNLGQQAHPAASQKVGDKSTHFVAFVAYKAANRVCAAFIGHSVCVECESDSLRSQVNDMHTIGWIVDEGLFAIHLGFTRITFVLTIDFVIHRRWCE